MTEHARRLPSPLWETVYTDLCTRLRRREFADRFPTDRELMDTYDVSRHTVREAVRRLQDDGVVKRERGRGSYVVDAGADQPLGSVYSLFRSIEASGASQDSLVLAQEGQANAQAAAVLALEPDGELFYLERVRCADGVPIAIDRAWLPFALAEPLLDVDFSHTALYDELLARCGCSPDAGTERIRPVVPGPAESRHLGLDPGQPALEIDRRTSYDGAPLEWRLTIIRGDRYLFSSEWSGTQSDVAPRLVAR
jgi:GntR family transcriptional regulator